MADEWLTAASGHTLSSPLPATACDAPAPPEAPPEYDPVDDGNSDEEG